YRQLDLPVETATRLIVQAMRRGKSQLVAPWWYRVVFLLARIFYPLINRHYPKLNWDADSR
ncbi:MAG: hypothetical protein Q7T89_04870, partial [Anaerolineales bacterium]|nr:hypothetical protein [Anaerolineales bacterium]